MSPMKYFYFIGSHHLTTWSNGHVTCLVGTLQLKWSMCQVWCIEVLWKWRYNVFVLSHDIAWPHEQKDVQLCEANPLNLSPHCAKFDACRPCGSWDITSLFGHVISHSTWSNEHVTFSKWVLQPKSPLWEVWYWWVF